MAVGVALALAVVGISCWGWPAIKSAGAPPPLLMSTNDVSLFWRPMRRCCDATDGLGAAETEAEADTDAEEAAGASVASPNPPAAPKPPTPNGAEDIAVGLRCCGDSEAEAEAEAAAWGCRLVREEVEANCGCCCWTPAAAAPKNPLVAAAAAAAATVVDIGGVVAAAAELLLAVAVAAVVAVVVTRGIKPRGAPAGDDEEARRRGDSAEADAAE